MTHTDADRITAAADPRRWKALAVLALIQFILVLDSTVTNVALPSIQRDLHFSRADLAWVPDGYLLMAGGLLLLGGRLADFLGRRRIFLIGTAVFAVGSLTAGLSQTSAELVASRFVQGFGEALAAPAALSIVAVLFVHPVERAKALGLWGGLAGLGGTVGVVLSGMITEYAGWRWVFFINLPFAAIALALTPRLVSNIRSSDHQPIDIPGAVLVTAALTSFVYGLINAASNPWGASSVAPFLAGGAVLMAVFVAREATARSPLTPLRFFRNRVRVSANILILFTTSALISTFFLLTLYMQQVLGYSPVRAGLAYVPFGVAVLAGIGLVTSLGARVPARVLLAAGYAMSALGLGMLSALTIHSGFVANLLPGTIVFGFGLGLQFPLLGILALHQVEAHEAGLASGVQSALQPIGGALGLSVLAAIAFRHAAASHSGTVGLTQGYVLAFTIAAGLLGLACVLAFVLVGQVGSSAEPAAPTSSGSIEGAIDHVGVASATTTVAPV